MEDIAVQNIVVFSRSIRAQQICWDERKDGLVEIGAFCCVIRME